MGHKCIIVALIKMDSPYGTYSSECFQCFSSNGCFAQASTLVEALLN